MDMITQLAEFRGLPKESLTDEADLAADLGLGSMDILEFVALREGEMSIQVDTTAAGDVRTVGDLKRLLNYE